MELQHGHVVDKLRGKMTDEDEQNDRAMLMTTKKRDSLFANEDEIIRACMTVHVCCKFRNLIFSLTLPSS